MTNSDDGSGPRFKQLRDFAHEFDPYGPTPVELAKQRERRYLAKLKAQGREPGPTTKFGKKFDKAWGNASPGVEGVLILVFVAIVVFAVAR